MEIPDDIFFLEPPDEKLHQQEREGEDDLMNLHVGPFTHPIDGIDRDVPDPESKDIQFYQEDHWASRNVYKCCQGPGS